MDKTQFKGYIRELVREMVQEEVERVLPKVLDKAIAELKGSAAKPAPAPASPMDKSRLAELMGLKREGDTYTAFGNVGADANSVLDRLPPGIDPTVKNAITRDYSDLMKKLK